METRNITLAIPQDVLLKAKLLAVKRQTSVSGLLTQTLERLVQQEEEAYTHARQRHLQWLEQGADLGTNGLLLHQDETNSTSRPDRLQSLDTNTLFYAPDRSAGDRHIIPGTWTKIAGAAQILDLLDLAPAPGTGTAQGVLVHEADISSSLPYRSYSS